MLIIKKLIVASFSLAGGPSLNIRFVKNVSHSVAANDSLTCANSAPKWNVRENETTFSEAHPSVKDNY